MNKRIIAMLLAGSLTVGAHSIEATNQIANQITRLLATSKTKLIGIQQSYPTLVNTIAPIALSGTTAFLANYFFKFGPKDKIDGLSFDTPFQRFIKGAAVVTTGGMVAEALVHKKKPVELGYTFFVASVASMKFLESINVI